MISVVITVHPPLLKHLERCIDSVLWQLSPADECIVIGDGCSALGARGFFRDARIKNFNTGEAKGECAARNVGLREARHDWIKFLDADDLLAPFALNAFRSVVGKLPDAISVLAGATIKVHNGLVVGYSDPPPIEQLITRVNPILPSMVFVRRSAAQAVAGFDERIDFEGDWDFWLRLRKAGYRFAIHRRPFCCYWIDDAERAEKEASRTHQVEGVDVREYLARTYGITPER